MEVWEVWGLCFWLLSGLVPQGFGFQAAADVHFAEGSSIGFIHYTAALKGMIKGVSVPCSFQRP